IMLRGYYEGLEAAQPDAGGAVAAGPQRWSVRAYRPTHDILLHEAIPNTALALDGKTFTINHWGMRDRDREKAKPPGTSRIAVLGSSVEMGHGLSDGACF